MNKKVAKLMLFKGYFIVGRFHSPRIGEFPLYPDNRLLFSQVKRLKVVAKELAKIIRPMKPDLIAAREAAGIPFGLAVALAINKNFLYLRKQPKGYNTNKIIEGGYQPGQRVVVVDDAMSTGKDKKIVIKVLEQAGLKVLGVVVVVDTHYGPKYRESQAWLRRGKKYKFKGLVTWPALMHFAADQKFLGRELCDMIANEMIYDPLSWQKKPANWQRFKQLAKMEKNLIFAESFKKI